MRKSDEKLCKEDEAKTVKVVQSRIFFELILKEHVY